MIVNEPLLRVPGGDAARLSSCDYGLRCSCDLLDFVTLGLVKGVDFGNM